jgi:hypothetical protein
MAKTTRKTEPTTGEKKPAVRRPKAAEAEGAPKGVKTPAQKTKKAAGATAIPAITASDVANLGQPVQAPAIPSEPSHDEIALRAWSIYERRGGGHGQAMNDWLEAKRQIVAERRVRR